MRKGKLTVKIFGIALVCLVAVLISSPLLSTLSPVNAYTYTPAEQENKPVSATMSDEGVTLKKIKKTLHLTDLDIDDKTLEAILNEKIIPEESGTLRDLAELVVIRSSFLEGLHKGDLERSLSALQKSAAKFDVFHRILGLASYESLKWLTSPEFALFVSLVKASKIFVDTVIETIEFGETIVINKVTKEYAATATMRDEREWWNNIVEAYGYREEKEWFREKEDYIYFLARCRWEARNRPQRVRAFADKVADLIRERVNIYKAYRSGEYTEGVTKSPTEVIVINKGEYPIYEVALVNERPLWPDQVSEPFPEIEPGGKRVLSFPFGVENIDHLKFIVMNVKVRIPFQVRTPPEVGEGAPNDVVLVMDISGSMDYEWGGEKKLSSTKKAAKALIDLMSPRARLAVVTFADSARIDIGLTSDFDAADVSIDGLRVGGDTNIGDALNKALNELETHSQTDARKAIIFFTDGHITTGMKEEGVLAGPVAKAKEKQIAIYAIGYGDPSYLHAEFLKKMAENTGGRYYYGTEAFQLENVFIEAGQTAEGWDVEAKFTGSIKHQETVTAGTFDLASRAEFLKVILNWPGSNLDLKIFDPREKELDYVAPNVVYSGDVKPEYILIKNPLRGTWSVKVHGKIVPSTAEYCLWIATYTRPHTPSSFIQFIPLVVSIALLLFIIGYFARRSI